MMKLKELECALQDVEGFAEPKILLEQYGTRPHIAACMLHTIQSQFGDIEGKMIGDLGCGCGILSIGCSMLGAGHVTAFDLDMAALDIFSSNNDDFGVVNVDMLQMDILSIHEKNAFYKQFDVIVMNPPYGTKHNKGIDMKFLRVACDMAKTAVYSLHKTSTRPHILKVCSEWKMKAQVVAELKYDIPATYRHHKHKSVDIAVDFYRIIPS